MVATFSRRRLLAALGSLGAASLAPAPVTVQAAEYEPMTREILTEPRTYYVRSDALYDDAPGLLDSEAGACQTWQQAIDLAASIDFNGHAVTIQHGSEGAHTFDENLAIGTMTGGGRLNIYGSSTPGNTVLSPTAGGLTAIIEARNTVTPVFVGTIKLEGSQCGIMATYLSTVNLLDGVVFGAIDNYHLFVHDNLATIIDVAQETTITGGAGYHMLISGGMAFVEYGETILTGTPAFSGAYIGLINGGRVQTVGQTFTGSATGSRYSVTMNSVLNTLGSGTSYLPGNSAGSTSSGGQYI
jgi:hypothetical protein